MRVKDWEKGRKKKKIFLQIIVGEKQSPNNY